MKWYRGDFHTHTVASDGKLTQEDIAVVKEKNQLDFIFLTDHNQLPSELRFDYLYNGIEVTEWTGHMNVHCTQKEKLNEVFESCTAFIAANEDILDQVHVSINHSFMDPWDFKEKDFPLQKTNSIEVICDPTWKNAPESNKVAVDFVNFLQSYGHRITGIGGSDSHLPLEECYEWSTVPSEYGDPATCICAESVAPKDILAGIKEGRVYVMRRGSLDINIQDGHYLPGDQIADDQITYKIAGRQLQETLKVELVMNNQVMETQNLENEGEITFDVAVGADYAAVSVVLYDQQGLVIGYVNPVYKGTAEPAFQTWGDAVAVFKGEA